VSRPAPESVVAEVLRGHASPDALSDAELQGLYQDSLAVFVHAWNRTLRGAVLQEEFAAAHRVALIATKLYFARCRRQKKPAPGGTPELRKEIEELTLELLAAEVASS
jgi:hypothetical protein